MTARLLFAFMLFPAVLLASPQAQRPSKATSPVQAPGRPAAARPMTAASVEEAVLLTNGWARIAEGQFAIAANSARAYLTAHPHSHAALSLLVDAMIPVSGAMAGLDQYEAWLGSRMLEEPLVVRRIAHAMLWEEASQQQDILVRIEALHALSNDGDAAAARELARAVSSRDAAQSKATGAGDNRGVPSLIDALNGGGSPVTAINALGASGSAEAVPALQALLNDDRIEVRGAAAEALGRIGNRQVTARLKPLLADHNVFVRTKAAEALLRLEDESGLSMLQQMLQDAEPEIRLSAAEALADRADSAWQSTVYQLLQDQDPVVRVGAAHLLATRDPDTARATLESLANDENAAIRELATSKLGDVATNDLPGLRRMLRAPVRSTRVKGAAGILRLTL